MTQFKEYGFYNYQIEAAETTEINQKGIIVMPTGTGKTFVQAGIIANNITNNPGFGVYVVNAPRIMLSYQLLEEFFKFNINNGIDARYMAVHSGKMEQNDLDKYRSQHSEFDFSQINSTTSPTAVNDMINKSKEANQPLILFSTYNSAIRIEQGRGNEKIKIILNDEAHYLVQERFNTDFNQMETERKYFFTATTKETPSDEGLGMNNVDFYGEKIYTMTPAEAIQMGKIVRPRVHIVSTNNGRVMTQDEVEKNLGRLVINSFNEHSKLLKNNLKAKMLIAASGLNDMKKLIGSNEIINFINNGGKFFAVASDQEVNNYINGKRVNRREFLKQLQIDGANPNQELIVIHYDILTEGIDVPGLTGVLFLRDQKKSKFIQTYGRVARLDRNDRRLINDKVISPSEIDKMNKPYAWIIVPAVKTEDTDKLANLENLISELRDFGFNPAEDIEPKDRGNGEGDDDRDPIVPEDSVRRVIGEVIEEYNHTIEKERIVNSTFEKIINNLQKTPTKVKLDLAFLKS
jgi:superfamily II DNA or RNA helicase